MNRVPICIGLLVIVPIVAVTLGIRGFLISLSEQETAIRVAKDSLLDCPTFGFDGIKDSIVVNKVM